MDDDGQHHHNDVKKIIKTSNKIKFNNQIIFGIRDLSFRKTPFKSFLGNKISSIIYKLITNDSLKDTQTGLRLYSTKLAKKFLKIKANGFPVKLMTPVEIKGRAPPNKLSVKLKLNPRQVKRTLVGKISAKREGISAN